MKSGIKIRQGVAEECVGCGTCQEECELLAAQGDNTPGMIAKAIGDQNPGTDITDFILKCSLCGLCKETCPQEVDVPQMVIEARTDFIEAGVSDPEQYRFLWVDHDWHAFSLYRRAYGLDKVYEPLLKETCDVLFFAGCLMANESPELVQATADWLEKKGGRVGASLFCCGAPLVQMGLSQRAKDYTERLWDHIDATGARRIVTACPTCHNRLSETNNREVEVISVFQLMAESGFKVDISDDTAITVHDSCSDRSGEIGRYVRQLLGNLSIKEMVHNGKNTICCGSGGIVSAIDPEICEDRAKTRLKEVRDVGVDMCVTYCMSCAHRLAGQSGPNEVRHILELILNQQVDHDGFNEKSYAMWQGEGAEENFDLLQQSEVLQQLSSK
jgi:fumarate reductase (CoM/CoB) subunit B